MINGHGDDLYKYNVEVKSNFSSNIYSHADLSGLKKHLSGRMDVIGSYPEPEPYSLEKALAEECGIEANEIMVTNGATEAIYLAARLTNEKLAGSGINLISMPTFSEYADACRMAGGKTMSSESGYIGKATHWMCNPNNPTGTVISGKELLNIAAESKNDIFVIDQSYEHYTTLKLISDREGADAGNIILIHSMTKQFCIPGLRLGYVTASPQLISRLKALRHPWSVNALAIEAGLYLIQNKEKAISDVGGLLDEAQRLRNELNKIDGVSVRPTKTNFMLASLKGRKAADLKEFLVNSYGILIRDASNFEGLDSSYFRVAAQTRAENDMLVMAIKDFMSYDRYRQQDK